jgi:mRNA-degrading endonuclease RelE of RelBE toxin-antitoxin system
MLNVEYSDDILKTIRKIKDITIKEKIKKQIKKIIEQPQSGKPMRYARKGTRELYIGSYRLAYSFNKEKNRIILLELYHKDKQ